MIMFRNPRDELNRKIQQGAFGLKKINLSETKAAKVSEIFCQDFL